MVQLPHDVWFYIARFLHRDVLANLLSVNSTFFYLGMDARYRHIALLAEDQHIWAWIWRLRDPAIARHVRVLSVSYAFSNEKEALPKSPSTPSCRTMAHRFFNFLHKPRETPVRQSLDEVLQDDLAGVIAGLHNLTHLNLERSYLNMLSFRFLAPAWPAFGDKLSNLTLNVTRAGLRELFSSASPPVLSSLMILNVDIEVDTYTADTVDALDQFLTFVCSLSSLRSLTLSGHDFNDDWALLFAGLGYLPHLVYFAVRLPFPEFQSLCVIALSQFIHRQGDTLAQLKLENISCWPSHLPAPVPTYPIIPLLANAKLRCLDALEVDFALLSDTAMGAVPALRPVLPTLSRLSVTEGFLQFHEARTVLAALQKCRPAFTALRLGLMCLTPESVDVLARSLPDLRQLELYVETAVGGFCAEMGARKYPKWALAHVRVISVFEEIADDLYCMRAIARAVPGCPMPTWVR